MIARILSIFAGRRQFLLYCVFGGSGVLLDFGLYSALVRLAETDIQVANAVGYASGTVLSFALNARLNFRTRDRLVLRFFAFAGTALLGWAVSALLLHVLVTRLGADKVLAKAGVVVVVVLLQYNLNRLVSFRPASGRDHA